MSANASSPGVGTRREETRTKILRAAEQLFARDGFDRVTLRQIARASDQGNVAAVQYHFGSKKGLLGEIVDAHRREIDEERQRLFEESEAEGRGEELASLIRILVNPLASKLDDPAGRAYLRIQAQGLIHDTMRPATRTLVQRIGKSLGALNSKGNPNGGDPYRNRFALLLLFHTLADRAREEEGGRIRRGDREEFVRSLGRAIEGLFSVSAPPRA
jgi:AcrR family transcriptional regulator